MGLIKWLTKDNTIRRRESAPPRSLQASFDPNKTRDESYREKMAKFTEFRTNERVQRLSMGPNELAAAYQTITENNDAENHVIERKERVFVSQRPNSQRINGGDECDHMPPPVAVNQHERLRTKKISVQFHLSNGTTDESEVSYKQHLPRHSMPAASHHSMYKHKSRKSKVSPAPFESSAIRENEIKEFESAIRNGSIDEDGYSNPLSPPFKFYRENSNPYPSIGMTSVSSEISELTASDSRSIRKKCPEKPKRLLVNSQQSRKLLTEAHFTGHYRNFEIQSPYYSEDSSTAFSLSSYNRGRRRQSRDTYESLNGDTASQPGRYQIITNKHGDDVEYALPCIDQLPQYQRQTFPPKFPEMNDSILAHEVFEEDPAKCEELINCHSESDSSESIPIPEPMLHTPSNNGRVMITDLDKSTDYSVTQDNLDSTREENPSGHKVEREELHVPIKNQIREYFESMQSAEMICLISDFIPKKAEENVASRMPLFIQSGTFKKSDATIRKYREHQDDPNLAYIAEIAIIRDLDVLRKIRHENIVNLMAIGFEPFRRISLIIEPTKCTLNQLIFERVQQLNLEEVVRIVKTIAKAILYLQECNLCHSNISSHSILVTSDVKNVKLSFFELTVPYKSDIQNEIELINLQKQKQNYSVREVPSKYLPYYVPYRRSLSMFNYQTPELLSRTDRFVFPTRQSDTYAITLLLWELLNRRIPFENYDEAKLNELLKMNYPLKFLPIKEEERCQRFHEIFERGLKREPTTRIELEKMISKLNAIELEICRENEKQVSPSKVEGNISKTKEKPLCNRLNVETIKTDDGEKATPDKSISKLSSIGISPSENIISPPMNNGANTTLHRSVLDFNKLLSPLRVGQNDTIERSSTLKRRKKSAAASLNPHKRNVRDLFNEGMIEGKNDDTLSADGSSIKMNELITMEQLSNELNNAHTKSSISRHLDYSINEDKEPSEDSNEQVHLRAPNRVSGNPFDNVQVLNTTNTSQQFSMDNYQLPQELIARNNKVRRYTWLSTDQMNRSGSHFEPTLVVATRSISTNGSPAVLMPSGNENHDSSNQRLNVSIKIVRKQLSPENSVQHNDSLKSESSVASSLSNEESISVKSRIKFFRSLESQPVQRRTPIRNSSNMSRHSEMSFKEARKAIAKTYRHTYPISNTTAVKGDFNQQLMKDISIIAAEIQENLARNPYLSEKEIEEREASKKIIEEEIELLNNHTNFNNFESMVEESEKRNSVREAVQKFELSMRNDKNEWFPFQKVENKLLNDKIINTEPKSPSFFNSDEHSDSVTEEKVEDLIRVEVPSEIENESASDLALCTDSGTQSNELIQDHQTQTLIKRTYYQESIVSGQNIELNDLMNNSPKLSSTYATTKKSLTTHVTLNMRKCRRRSSDVGRTDHQSIIDVYGTGSNTVDQLVTPRMADVRHSICGSPQQTQAITIATTSGRKLGRISSETLQSHGSGLRISSDMLAAKKIQSIEDLYIDDDFGGSNLAANMKLMTNSMDLLDGIDFDLISTRIYEETMSTNGTALAIADGKEIANRHGDENTEN